MKSIIQASILSLFALSVAPVAQAAWPDKPIKLIVPAAPGGTTDITARLLSEKIGAELGTTVVVENRAGAAGIIGSQALIQAPPDGYTIGFGNIGPNGINYSLYKKLPYKHTDFSPITLVISVPNVLVVNSKSPYKTVKELVDAIKSDPKGNFTFASSGTGQSPHMSAEMFAQRTGTNLTHVPFKGMGPAVAALLGGQVTFAIDNLPSSIGFIRSGQFRALAVTGAERSPQLPDVPTMAEAGIKDMVVTAWFGFVAPAGTPPDIINKIQQATKKVLETPEIQKRFAEMGGVPGGNTPAEFGAFMDKERESWRKIVEAAKLQME
ncbi:Bug family tripartite tricarboxylate transporter substrate binding protein [Zwartia panacis]|jgi:tripartite-type tricarboxylate transporter receptor subunit TctC|uniref:Bug family tripartite tricarboxylate transporter substrate binding protein n=1 Tax=Zwartia panacis TaxID=2683345 RepID=UPI0025B2FE87|nr:tripartite tricarboxylate transporter substrate binding protein [Zwartia panacis]MDN4017886.1 tripartite tricarboxylate transporter substrate binding protein [Zwartia panacis]